MVTLTGITTGDRFGALVALEPAREPVVRYQTKWICRCDCGVEKSISSDSLKRGLTKSCGCRRSEVARRNFTTHGQSDVTPAYSSWKRMLSRCYCETNISYSNYGGRGITVCEAWHSFENFFVDMGEKPPGRTSIERLDVNGNYEPGNCVWATHHEQMRNTRRTRLNIEIVKALRSGAMSPKEVMQQTGCSYSAVKYAKRGRTWAEV